MEVLNLTQGLLSSEGFYTALSGLYRSLEAPDLPEPPELPEPLELPFVQGYAAFLGRGGVMGRAFIYSDLHPCSFRFQFRVP